MTEVSALKNAVSRFQAERGKIPAGAEMPIEVVQQASRAQAISKTNPVAVEQFLEKYPHLKTAHEAAISFEIPKPKAPKQTIAEEGEE